MIVERTDRFERAFVWSDRTEVATSRSAFLPDHIQTATLTTRGLTN